MGGGSRSHTPPCSVASLPRFAPPPPPPVEKSWLRHCFTLSHLYICLFSFYQHPPPPSCNEFEFHYTDLYLIIREPYHTSSGSHKGLTPPPPPHTHTPSPARSLRSLVLASCWKILATPLLHPLTHLHLPLFVLSPPKLKYPDILSYNNPGTL